MSAVPSSLTAEGYAILPVFLEPSLISELIKCVQQTKLAGPSAMHSAAVYAIRRAFHEVSGLEQVLNDPVIRAIVGEVLGDGEFITKSIWFEKPPGGNWFVGWHQDISISVARRIDVPGYSRWTAKHGVIGVVPPLSVLHERSPCASISMMRMVRTELCA